MKLLGGGAKVLTIASKTILFCHHRSYFFIKTIKSYYKFQSGFLVLSLAIQTLDFFYAKVQTFGYTSANCVCL